MFVVLYAIAKLKKSVTLFVTSFYQDWHFKDKALINAQGQEGLFANLIHCS